MYNMPMDIRIKTTDYQMVPEVSDYINERVGVIGRHLGADAELARIEVEVGRASGKARHGEYLWFAEFNVSYPGGPSVHAKNHEDSINAAIDRAKEEVVVQLRKGKQLHRRVLRRGGAAFKRFMRFGGAE